jgi:hypothetical protein
MKRRICTFAEVGSASHCAAGAPAAEIWACVTPSPFSAHGQ